SGDWSSDVCSSDLSEEGVKQPRDVAGELDVLPLILTDGNQVGAIEQDVRRLQHGVREQPRPYALEIGRPGLELNHALEPADRRHAAEEPCQFCVCADARLNE